MLLITCPNCGPRNASEFRFGGEKNARPPQPEVQTDDEWAAYLYMRPNVRGVQTEWWYHRHGCSLWFYAERNTLTNEVLRTYLYGEGS